MSDLKRISLPAMICLVLLRVSIGWQFLYEGLWKYNTHQTAQPWTSEGYLKNAQGPFRDHFRGMTGDPDDLKWLDYDAMVERWQNWRTRFDSHFGPLSKEQNASLDRMLKGPSKHSVAIGAIPESAKAPLEKLSNVIKYDEQAKRLTVDGNNPLVPAEAATLYASVPVVKLADGYAKVGADGEAERDANGAAVPADPVDLEFYKAIETLERESAKLGYLQRLAAQLKGNPDRVGVVSRGKDNRLEMAVGGAGEDAQWLKYGEVQVYRDLLEEYEAGRKLAATDFQHEQLRLIWQKVQAKRAELVGPIRALDAELKREALGLLSSEQRARGALPPEQTQLWQVDQLTIAGLVILGALLILGLGTRLAALAGAVMLVMFYLPLPPWPGVYMPPEATGPEHSYIINKNLIEAIALVGIAMLPTGSWFGLDGVIRYIFRRGK